jgi:DNA-binding transcriptional regulator YdaS (Cro superfamily)
MTLSKYLKRKDAMTLTALAAELGVSKGRLSQLRNASDWPPELALAAESKTGGALNASALSQVIARARQTGAAAA